MAAPHSLPLCEVCKNEYEPTRNQDGSPRKTKYRLCSIKCRNIHRYSLSKGSTRRERAPRKPTRDHARKRLPCSVEGCTRNSCAAGMCSRHYYRVRKYGNPAFTMHGRRVSKHCEWCGEVMSLRPGIAKIRRSCSVSCASKIKARSKGLTLHASKSAKDAHFSARRRAAIASAERDAIDPIAVFQRDEWRCHLCGRKTIQAQRGTYKPRAPELDHVVSLVDGGTHTWGNVACSCRACNNAKRARSRGQINLGFPV